MSFFVTKNVFFSNTIYYFKNILRLNSKNTLFTLIFISFYLSLFLEISTFHTKNIKNLIRHLLSIAINTDL